MPWGDRDVGPDVEPADSGGTAIPFTHLTRVLGQLVAQLVKNLPAMQETPVQFLGQENPTRRRLPAPVFLDFPGGSASKESACNAGYPGSIPGSGRSPGEGNGSPLQCFGLENSVGCIVHGVTKSQLRLSNLLHFTSGSRWPLEAGAPSHPVGGRRPGGVAKDRPSLPGPAQSLPRGPSSALAQC